MYHGKVSLISGPHRISDSEQSPFPNQRMHSGHWRGLWGVSLGRRFQKYFTKKVGQTCGHTPQGSNTGRSGQLF
jgi:hypothetical protein